MATTIDTVAAVSGTDGDISPSPAIVVDGVSLSRQADVILEDVSLTVNQGDFLALLGPNGGGKTTLLRIILGLLAPDAGTVSVFGKAPQAARAHIGYVPQFSSIRQEFPATVLETVLMGGVCGSDTPGKGFRSLLWPDDGPAREKAMALLDTLDIADIASNSVSALSGGQRQRLMVARALMGRRRNVPFLLLLDEPTASIDQHGKGCFYEFLGTLRKEITIIIVSHDLAMATPFFSHVALVNKTLSMLPDACPHTDVMRDFLGQHGPECPLWHITHAEDDTCACHASALRPSANEPEKIP